MNILQQQIVEEIEALNSLPIECDGFTRLAATVLHRNQQEFQVFTGKVMSESGAMYPVHFWIEWNDRIIDFRAKMWLGSDAQHGFLHQSEVAHLYSGEEIDIPPLSPVMESILKTPFPAEFMEKVEQSNKAIAELAKKTNKPSSPKI